MPKRTNLFQEVVEIIHRHMAGEAEVESPALLPSGSTGDLREVDVVIRGNQAGHEVIVSVEAIARSRKAAVGWVEEMVGKHDDLPTSKLVLVSDKGFTRQAREVALARAAVPLAPEDLPSEDRDAAVIRVLPALWPKVVTFTLETIGVNFVDDDVPKDGWGQTPPLVGIVDGGEGEIVGNLEQVAELAYKSNFADLMEELGVASIEQDRTLRVVFAALPKEGDVVQLPIDGELRSLYVINEKGIGYDIRSMTLAGKAEIKVSRIPLTGRRLGEIDLAFAYGEGKVGGRDALLVVTERAEGKGTLTIRVRPEKK